MRLPIFRLAILPLCIVLLANCASAQQKSRGDRGKLTRVDIDEGGSSIASAREAVRILRPQWLAPPMGKVASSDVMGGGGGGLTVIVYIDDVRQPDLESLATVPAAMIFELRYLDQNRAVLLRGPGHEGGVIEVTTLDKRK